MKFKKLTLTYVINAGILHTGKDNVKPVMLISYIEEDNSNKRLQCSFKRHGSLQTRNAWVKILFWISSDLRAMHISKILSAPDCSITYFLRIKNDFIKIQKVPQIKQHNDYFHVTVVR